LFPFAGEHRFEQPLPATDAQVVEQRARCRPFRLGVQVQTQLLHRVQGGADENDLDPRMVEEIGRIERDEPSAAEAIQQLRRKVGPVRRDSCGDRASP
jgi:hypothetical protein